MNKLRLQKEKSASPGQRFSIIHNDISLLGRNNRAVIRLVDKSLDLVALEDSGKILELGAVLIAHANSEDVSVGGGGDRVGGFSGKGIGEGTQNTLGFLPQTISNNDFIFSVIAEETGYLGSLFLIACYLMLFFSVFILKYLPWPMS